MRRIVQIVAIALLLFARARADPPDRTAEATRLFDEGRALAKQGDVDSACDRFARSLQLLPAPGTELNVADCKERQGHPSEAWHHFDHAAVEAERAGNASRARYARDRADALLPRLATIVVKIAQPQRAGLSISIAGRVAPPAAEVREYVDPGVIVVVATAPGTPRFERSVQAVAGATVGVDVEALGERATVRRRRRVYLAGGLATAAGAGAITAIGVLVTGRREYRAAAGGPNCSVDSGGRLVCDNTGLAQIGDAQRLADVSTALAVGSGVLLVGAAVVYLTAPRDSIVVTPFTNGHGIGVGVSGAF